MHTWVHFGLGTMYTKCSIGTLLSQKRFCIPSLIFNLLEGQQVIIAQWFNQTISFAKSIVTVLANVLNQWDTMVVPFRKRYSVQFSIKGALENFENFRKPWQTYFVCLWVHFGLGMRNTQCNNIPLSLSWL